MYVCEMKTKIYLIKDGKNKKEGRLTFEIYRNYKRFRYKTPTTIRMDEWDNDEKQVKEKGFYGKKLARQINDRIDQMAEHFEKLYIVF